MADAELPLDLPFRTGREEGSDAVPPVEEKAPRLRRPRTTAAIQVGKCAGEALTAFLSLRRDRFQVRRIVIAVIGGMLVLGMLLYIAAGLGRLDYLSRILRDPFGAVSITRQPASRFRSTHPTTSQARLRPGQTFYSLSRGLGLTAGEVNAAVQAAKPVDLTRLAAGMPYRAMMEPSSPVSVWA